MIKLKARVSVEGMKEALGQETVSDDMETLAREVSARHARGQTRAEQELARLEASILASSR